MRLSKRQAEGWGGFLLLCQHTQQKQLKEGRLALAHSLRMQTFLMGKDYR